MNDGQLQIVEQVRQFLEGSERIEFRGLTAKEKYCWIEEVLIRFGYHRLKKSEKGMIRRYVQKVTGYSRSQVSRLIAEYKRTGRLKKTEYRRHRFPWKYTPSEVGLLARTDELISVAHLYNLRRSNIYWGMTRRFTSTKPVVSKIGERAKPDPKGQPGHIRIDTLHQGDINGQKGVYHINAVDEVAQWEIVALVERISEAYLVSVLESMLVQFPFIIRGFHSDNGSEFVNHIVARLLNKLLVRFTKSRPRHPDDNGLVETKNGSVIRKNLGYAYIPQACAALLNEYHQDYLNPYINFHRPCFFPVPVIDHRGKIRKIYP
jgi:transposase InsO family protein